MLETKDISQELEEKPTSNIEDPFAVDFFGSSVSIVETEQEIVEIKEETEFAQVTTKVEKIKPKRWERNLRKMSKSEANLSNELNFLPFNLATKGFSNINQTLSHYLFGLKEDVKSEVLDIREVDIRKEAMQAMKEESLFVSFWLEPRKSFGCIILDAELASHLVDKTLGGTGFATKIRRKLSNIEKTVIEFLGVSLLSELNNLYGESVWKVGTIEQNLPNWIEENSLSLEDSSEKKMRGISAILNLTIGQTNRILTILLSPEFLSEVNNSESKYFEPQSKAEKFKKYKKIKPLFDLRISLGESEFRASEIANLEAGDYVFIEKHQIDWEDSILSAQANVQIGAKNGLNLLGNISQNEKGKLVFQLEESLLGEIENNWERLAMSEEDLTAENEDFESLPPAELALESILLNVRVELAGRKMTLEEVSKLRKGQIIELGCKATDAVELLADEKRIATGDLVDIEGNLGIALTKVYL
jgi:flagellar motor switch/type III secretory pathway protein FliN